MQYKGFKRMKRMAAVILSAAIVLTDVPGVSAAEYGRTTKTEVSEEMTAQDAAAKEAVEEKTTAEYMAEETATKTATTEETAETEGPVTTDTASVNETSKNTEADDETAGEQTNTQNSADADEQASDFGVETGASQTETQTANTESEGSETQTAEAEETQTQETLTEEPVTEESASQQDTYVPIPDVDDSVYALEHADNTYMDNTASIVSYNANGTLEKNEQGEYRIDNKDQFILFLESDTDYSDSTVILNCDVDMKGATAQHVKVFEGTFLGNGHSIYNYKADGALFKEIGANGEVKGLHLSAVTFSQERASAALALTNNGSISDITVNADMKVTKDMTAAAGIVLENAGRISGCVFAGSITADSATDNTTKTIGGIVSSNKGTIENCHALGSIQTNAAALGGIAGANSKIIKNCTNHMSITGAFYLGGIAAENTGTVSGCANYGAITQKSSSEDGLAGGITATNTEKISGCENYAAVSGEYKNIGGITGSSSGAVTDCGNYAGVSGSENVGGIIGLFNGTGDDETNLIQNSFNKGRIDAKANGSSRNLGIGGILGAASKNVTLKIENCYNTAGINGAAETKNIGGIVGVLYRGSISNVYNTGNISAAESTESFNPYAAMIAGFMGAEEEAAYANCLFLEGRSDTLCYRESGAVAGEDAKRTAGELKSADTVTVLGNGFASDDSNINDGYPVIKGQHAQTRKYVLVYEPNGGCADSYFSVSQNGASVSQPSSPVKRGASFMGWFKDKACTAKYNFSDSVTKSEVLYAGWESGKLVEDIILDQTEVTLVREETFNLKEKVRFVPESAENTALSFRSGDSSVATVDDAGIVKAVSEGTAKITVTMADGSLDKELTFKVNVSDKANIVRFKLYDDKSTAEITRLSISVNDPVTVQAVFGSEAPKDATVQWSSNRPDYVKVTGRTDLVNVNAVRLDGLKPTAQLDENSVDIMCTLIYPDHKTTFTSILKVTVKPLAEKVSVQAGREDVTDKTVIYDLGMKKFIAVGETKLSEPTDTLSASILPKAANQKVKWSSSDSYILKFNDDESGKAEGRVVGEATVTATAADGSTNKDGKPVIGKTTVKVRRIIQELSFTPKPMDGKGTISVDKNGRIEIAEGTSIKLVPTYNPVDATEKKLKWTNGNKNAIELTKVEEGTNVLVVTAKKVAQDTIVKLRADAMDMGAAFCEVEFIIKPKVEKIKIFRTDDTNRDNNLSGKNIGIDPEKDDMTFSLMTVNEPDNASQMVTWKISNTKVADFKDNEDGTCTIQVKGMGTAAITATATDGSKTTATTTLNVTSLASNVDIEGSNVVMKGKTIKLKATVYPKSAQNKNIRWTSSAPDLASVNPNTGEVRGIKAGFVLVTATANDGSGASGTHAIWVKDPVEDFDIMEPDGDDNIKNDKILTGKTIGLDPDDDKGTYTVVPRILPDTACQDVEWKSGNEKIATVENGVITAKALGRTTITMSAVDGSGRKASITVNIGTLVKNIEITGGHYVGIDQELQLKAKVGNKDATSKAVIWKSDNPRAATIEEDGLVTGIKDGDAIITAEAADGSGVIAEHRIYVIKEKNDVSISAYDNCTVSTKNKRKYVKDNSGYDDIDLSNRKNYVLRLRAELSNGSSIRDGVPMDIKWSTSDKSIASIEPEENNSGIGVVTIHKAGTVKITAMTAEGYEKSEYVTMTVTNTNPYVEITGPGHRLASGKKMKLSTGSIAVDWASDNESVAKVNNKGQVTACKGAAGTVNIVATALDGINGKGNSDTYTIYVGDPVSEVDITMNGYTVTGEKIGIDLMKGYKESSTVRLDALLDGAVSDDVTWKSSNKGIAELDEYGYVDFKKNGTVTFTATAGDGSNKKGKVTFVITKQITGMSPAGDIGNIDLGYKKSVQLNIDYKPLSCTMKKANWESSDPSVVSVNKKSGKITGKSEGVAIITATAADNSDVSCSFTVTVDCAVNKVEIVKSNPGTELPDNEYQDVIGIDLSTSVNTAALKANLYTKVGKEYEEIGSQRVSWKSSNEKIAKVDENGVVTAIKSGEVTITATALDGSKKSGKVKVYIGKLIKSLTPSDKIKDGITLNLRGTKTLEIAKEFKIAPITATNQTLVYTSSDKKIVTVNAKGKITGKKVGEAEIIVTPRDGSGIVIRIPVEVTK